MSHIERRKRPDGLRRAVLAAVGAVAFMVLLGYAVLLFVPASDLDRKCLKEPLATVGMCIREYYREIDPRYQPARR